MRAHHLLAFRLDVRDALPRAALGVRGRLEQRLDEAVQGTFMRWARIAQGVAQVDEAGDFAFEGHGRRIVREAFARAEHALCALFHLGAALTSSAIASASRASYADLFLVFVDRLLQRSLEACRAARASRAHRRVGHVRRTLRAPYGRVDGDVLQDRGLSKRIGQGARPRPGRMRRGGRKGAQRLDGVVRATRRLAMLERCKMGEREHQAAQQLVRQGLVPCVQRVQSRQGPRKRLDVIEMHHIRV